MRICGKKLIENLRFLLVVCFVFLMAGSCVPSQMVKPAHVFPTADVLAEKLIERQADLKRFAGRGDIQFKDENSDYHLDIIIAFNRPDRFRFQAFDLLGRPALTLVSNNGVISIMDYKEKRFYRGPASAANMRRFLPLGLSGNEAMNFFSGGALLTEFERASIDQKKSAPTDVVLNLYRENAAWAERIWLDPNTLQVNRIDLGPTIGDVLMRITYADFDEERIPRRLELTELDRIGDLVVNYKEIKINTDLPSQVFQLEIPAGLSAEPLPD